MEIILQYLGTVTSDPASIRIIFIVLAAGTVFVFGLGVSWLALGASDPLRRRLSRVAAEEPERNHRRRVSINTLVGPVAQYVLPKEEIERSKTNEKLVHAGFRSVNALQVFYATKAVLAITLPALVVFMCQWFPSVTTNSVIIYSLIGAGAGVFGPNYVLDRLLQRRQRKLRHGFPDALDLLVTCVEAGLGLSQAIERVARELSVSHPELAMELALVNAETRAGVENVAALKNLVNRCGLEDIRGLVSLLVQTIRFGTSVAESLRVYSEEFRDKRTQAAEEQAAKIGTKLIFPLVLFLFPGFFVVVVGPAVIALGKVFDNF